MNHLKNFGIAAIILSLSALAWGQAAKPLAKPAKPAAKSTAKAAPAASPAAPVELSPEQVSIAQIVTTGRIGCGDGQSVTITADPKVNGAFDVQFGKAKYDVVPVPAKSGAVRLEDTKTGIVFMQLANKSMLFNEKLGRRLADDCVSPAQQAVADQMKANPTAGVLDAPAK
jgi:hypothetical protein